MPPEITPPLQLRAKKENGQFLTLKIVKNLDEKIHIKSRRVPDSQEKYYYCGYCVSHRWGQYESEDAYKKVWDCEIDVVTKARKPQGLI